MTPRARWAEGRRVVGPVCQACKGRGGEFLELGPVRTFCDSCLGSGASIEAIDESFPPELAPHPGLVASGPWRARGERPFAIGELVDGSRSQGRFDVEIHADVRASIRTLVATQKGVRIGFVSAWSSAPGLGAELSFAPSRSAWEQTVSAPGLPAIVERAHATAADFDERVAARRWQIEFSVDIGPAVDGQLEPRGSELAVMLALLAAAGVFPRFAGSRLLAWASVEEQSLRITAPPDSATTELMRCHTGPVVFPGSRADEYLRRWSWFELWRVGDLADLVARLRCG